MWKEPEEGSELLGECVGRWSTVSFLSATLVFKLLPCLAESKLMDRTADLSLMTEINAMLSTKTADASFELGNMDMTTSQHDGEETA
jgi:hypothetical protein